MEKNKDRDQENQAKEKMIYFSSLVCNDIAKLVPQTAITTSLKIFIHRVRKFAVPTFFFT